MKGGGPTTRDLEEDSSYLFNAAARSPLIQEVCESFWAQTVAVGQSIRRTHQVSVDPSNLVIRCDVPVEDNHLMARRRYPNHPKLADILPKKKRAAAK